MIPHVNNEHTSKLEDDIQQLDGEQTNATKWYDQLLLNRPLKVIVILLLASVLAPALIYQFLFFESLDLPPSDGFSIGSCLVPRTSRLMCGKGNVTAEECHQQCCYDLDSHICFHRYPSRFSYLMDFPWSEEISLQPRVATVPYNFQNSIRSIRLSIDEISSTHLSLTFYNPAEKSMNGKRIAEKNYTYEIGSPELNVIVTAQHGNVFNTNRGPLIASNDIWEVAFTLTEGTMYGFGQIPIKEDTHHVIYSHPSGMNSLPLIFAKSNGSYHGLLIDVTEPTEVYFGRNHQIVVRSITNSGLKFHVFVGPKPVDVMNDVLKLLKANSGVNKQLQYWMLGAHVCSETTQTAAEALTNLNTFISEATSHNMPFESHCGTAPVVFDSACDTTLFNNIDAGAIAIKSAGRKFVPHVSPYILYKDTPEISEEINGTETKSFEETESNCSNLIKNYKDFVLRDSKNEKIYVGLVNNAPVIYPDYENISEDFINSLWKSVRSHNGVVLENNWPLDESWTDVNETHEYLPYWNENFEWAFYHTPQWNVTRPNGERYLYNHNQYGNYFSTAFEKMSEHNPIWSSSQWMRTDLVVNRQNITTSWSSFHKELIEAALGGVSGNWLWSSPICGDTDNFNNESHISVCIKWYMAATYMPMIKIHSKNSTRDPLAFAGTNRMLMTTALTKRMSLLPYFYSVLQEGPLLRTMFFQYPESESLSNLTSQFNVGDSILIVPNLQPMQSHVHIWMPPGVWFEFWSGLRIDGEEGEAVTLTTTEADFLTLLKGGSIIAMQKDTKATAEQTRLQSGFSLTVAIDCGISNSTDEEKNETKCHANGHIFMNENMTLVFEADGDKLRITAKGDDFDVLCNVDEALWAHTVIELNIYGLNDTLNNYDHHKHVQTNIDLCELVMESEIRFSFNYL